VIPIFSKGSCEDAAKKLSVPFGLSAPSYPPPLYWYSSYPMAPPPPPVIQGVFAVDTDEGFCYRYGKSGHPTNPQLP
jgi:hypothetical protein